MWPVGSQNSTNNDWCLTQDIDEANRLLDEAGYEDSDGDGIRNMPGGGDNLEFDFVTSTNAVRQSNQALIETYWAEIGVKANMKNEDAGLFFDGTGASPVNIWSFFTDIEMFTNGSTGPDAGGYLKSWITEQIPEESNNWSGDNIPRLASDEYDALIAQIAVTGLDDPGKLGELGRSEQVSEEGQGVVGHQGLQGCSPTHRRNRTSSPIPLLPWFWRARR